LSAKGTLKQGRDPKFQALFAIKGVSANVYKMTLDQIVGPNGNTEFTSLVTVLGCNVGSKFDLDKLNYDKIIISSDADVDGLWIRSLLLAFFFKVLPEVVKAGKVYISEPPLYRVDDKKNPFVVNMADYMNRYALMASKEYKLGYKHKMASLDIEWLEKKDWIEFLDDTKTYVEDIQTLVSHYKVNDRLLEIVLSELITSGFDETASALSNIKKINIQHMMNRIGEEFGEIYFDDKDNIIRGVIDSKWQELEISEGLIRKATGILRIIRKWAPEEDGCIVIRNVKNFNEQNLSLLGALKILQKFKPNILHRYKGLITRPYYLNCGKLLVG